MRFNLWFEGHLEEENADIGTLLRWIGELRFDEDFVVDVGLYEHIKEED